MRPRQANFNHLSISIATGIDICTYIAELQYRLERKDFIAFPSLNLTIKQIVQFRAVQQCDILSFFYLEFRVRF